MLSAPTLRDVAFAMAQAGALVGALWLFRQGRARGGVSLDVAVAAGTLAGALALGVLLRLPGAIAGHIALFDGGVAMAQVRSPEPSAVRTGLHAALIGRCEKRSMRWHLRSG